MYLQDRNDYNVEHVECSNESTFILKGEVSKRIMLLVDENWHTQWLGPVTSNSTAIRVFVATFYVCTFINLIWVVFFCGLIIFGNDKKLLCENVSLGYRQPHFMLRILTYYYILWYMSISRVGVRHTILLWVRSWSIKKRSKPVRIV